MRQQSGNPTEKRTEDRAQNRAQNRPGRRAGRRSPASQKHDPQHVPQKQAAQRHPTPKQTTQTVRFLLGDQLCSIDNPDPTQTVLDFLRTEQGRAGLKEGCAEGDCGACSAALWEIDAQGRRQGPRIVNTCILFLPMLHRKQLATVEDLSRIEAPAEGVSAPEEATRPRSTHFLHPAQAALVEAHGSQCGFCTPGFAMSLYGLYHHDKNPSRRRIDDALAGNLCRCTGYQPIVQAAQAMRRYPSRLLRCESARACEALAKLNGNLDSGEPGGDRHDGGRPGAGKRDGRSLPSLSIQRRGRRFFAPRNEDELGTLLEKYPQARLLAGGTDVGLEATKKLDPPQTLIFLGDVPSLRRIERGSKHLTLGATVTYAEAFADFAALHPDFGEVWRRLGGYQVRSLGTVGGNIGNASPIGDTPPLLIAAGATLVLQRGSGNHVARREIPLEDYFIRYGQQDRYPGEYIKAVRVPVLPGPVLPAPGAPATPATTATSSDVIPAISDGTVPQVHLAAYKVSKRFDQDISTVLGAFLLRLDPAGSIASARICYGGMAGIPARAPNCENALRGKPWNLETVAQAQAALAEDYQPISDWRGTAAYRRSVARNLLRRFFIETTEPATRTRVLDPLPTPLQAS